MDKNNPAVFGVTDSEYQSMLKILNMDRLSLQDTVDHFVAQQQEVLNRRLKESLSVSRMYRITLQELADLYAPVPGMISYAQSVEAPPVEFWKDGRRHDENGNDIGLIQDFTQGKDYK